MALFVRKADANPSATEEQAVELAPRGGVVSNTVQITANVEAIDDGKRTVDVKGPLGNVRTLKVDKRVKNFDQVKMTKWLLDTLKQSRFQLPSPERPS